MLTVFKHTLFESLHRRVAVILIILAVVIVAVLLMLIRFETADDGTLLATTGRMVTVPASSLLPGLMNGLLQFSLTLWLFVALFAAAPLLTTHLEKGWVELLLSKGVPRWQIVLGRYAGAVGLVAVALFVLNGLPAIYFWLRAGYSPGKNFGALLLALFSFAAVLALMNLLSVLQMGSAIPVMAGYLQLALSSMLANRTAFYAFLTSDWVQFFLDWSYRILPKHSELGGLASVFLEDGAIDAWWPIWSTGLFLVGALGLSCWVFHRKSF